MKFLFFFILYTRIFVKVSDPRTMGIVVWDRCKIEHIYLLLELFQSVLVTNYVKVQTCEHFISFLSAKWRPAPLKTTTKLQI